MNETPSDSLPLFSWIAHRLDLARKQVVTAVNLAMVHTYYEIESSSNPWSYASCSINSIVRYTSG